MTEPVITYAEAVALQIIILCLAFCDKLWYNIYNRNFSERGEYHD